MKVDLNLILEQCEEMTDFSTAIQPKTEKGFWYLKRKDKTVVIKKWKIPNLFRFDLYIKGDTAKIKLNPLLLIPIGMLYFISLVFFTSFLVFGSKNSLAFVLALLISGVVTLSISKSLKFYKKVFNELIEFCEASKDSGQPPKLYLKESSTKNFRY